jgi:hypothetical protein
MDSGATTRKAIGRGRTNGLQPNAGLPSTDRPETLPTFWLFELEDDGTVLYSRPRIADNELKGHNFFDECLGFEDIPKYRQHFYSFIKSKKAAASFIWRCSSATGSMNTKVLMTRAFSTGSYPPTGVVMMEIRGC